MRMKISTAMDLTAEAMAWAVGGVSSPARRQRSAPQGTATRAQAATILMRFSQSIEK